MAVDPTARRANIKDSIKKFFIDNLYTIEGIDIGFDTSLDRPRTVNRNVIRWVNFRFGELDRETGTLTIEIYCCTRQDNEGFKLAQLTDTVMDYLTDSDQNDGTRRVPIYRSRATGAWTLLDGGFMILPDTESEELDADDDTKYIVIPTTWRWGTKI